MRTDLHTLFDSGMLAIDPDTRRVVLASPLLGSDYAAVSDVRIAEPSAGDLRPSSSHLAAHLAWCAERLH
jgi:hypothetical protein